MAKLKLLLKRFDKSKVMNRSDLRKLLNASVPIRKIPKQNILYKLRDREIGGGIPNLRISDSKSFYSNIFPNFTVAGIEKPPCFLRKFSPNGKHFIAFSFDQTSVEIYEFQGSQAAEKLLDGVGGDYLPPNPDPHSTGIRTSMFGTFFHLKHITSVATDGEGLNRECSLFTEDSKFVIVGSEVYLPEEPYPSYRDIYKNNESLLPCQKSLEDYSLHVIRLEDGVLCDTRRFKCDKIYLSHNQGVYLYRRTLAVLSVQHQTIHLFQLSDEGKLTEIKSVGRFCFEDDQYLVSATSSYFSRDGFPRNPPGVMPYDWGSREKVFCTLKQKLLIFLFKKAQSEMESQRDSLTRFYQNFEFFSKLKLWKMQLLDEDHLLIRYAAEDVVTMKCADPNSQPSFFAFFEIQKARFLAFYENTSPDLLSLFENYNDYFKISGSPSNIFSRQIQKRFKQTITNARCGGHSEATKRILAQLPISAQSYSHSPYLDSALFSFDDKWVSAMERPKTSGDHAIRFYSRESGLLKFKIYTGLSKPALVPVTTRRLVAFTFHPFEPFAISVQRTHSDYVVNFHVRHESIKDDNHHHHHHQQQQTSTVVNSDVV